MLKISEEDLNWKAFFGYFQCVAMKITEEGLNWAEMLRKVLRMYAASVGMTLNK